MLLEKMVEPKASSSKMHDINKSKEVMALYCPTETRMVDYLTMVLMVEKTILQKVCNAIMGLPNYRASHAHHPGGSVLQVKILMTPGVKIRGSCLKF